jgi:hypothetical protein
VECERDILRRSAPSCCRPRAWPGRPSSSISKTAGQYAANFRKIAGPGNPAQTGPTVDNDYVRLSGTSNFTFVIDTTPADANEKTVFTVSQGNPVTFSADLRFSTATSSFGVYFVDPANEANGYLALLNIDQTGTNELIRFASNGIPNTGGAGTLVTGGTGDAMALNQFANAFFTYDIDANNHPVLSVSFGSLTGSVTFDTITTPLTSVELAIRDSSQNIGNDDFDNVRGGNALARQPNQYDVVIYGGTSGGIAAAVQAARMGKTVALIEPTGRIGGMTTNGLSFTDLGNTNAIQGLAREFYVDVGQRYGSGAAEFKFEPKVALSVFQDWVHTPGISLFTNERLDLAGGVVKQGSRIESIRMEGGLTFGGSMFIDAGYEGDLMARAGVTYAVGRESNATYGERYNGVQRGAPGGHNFSAATPVDPYVVPDNPASGLLPGINPGAPAANGTDAYFQVTGVPEPSTAAATAALVALAALTLRRRRRAAAQP